MTKLDSMMKFSVVFVTTMPPVPHWETASCGQCFKGDETPFRVAICNTDPTSVILVRNEPHIATWSGGNVSGAGPDARPALGLGLYPEQMGE
jgi:hypothetical protein